MKALQKVTEPHQVFAIEAARYSYLLASHAHQRLSSELRGIESEIASEMHTTDNRSVAAFESAWQLIDMGFRFGRLLHQIRGLKHNSPEFQLTERVTREIEHFRNIFQHIDNHISGLSGESNPILGSLSWVSSDEALTLALTIGTQPAGVEFSSIPFDKETQRFTRTLVLSAGKKDIELNHTMTILAGGYTYLEHWLTQASYLGPRESASTFAAMRKDEFARVAGTSNYRFVRITMRTHQNKRTEP